MKRLLTPTLLFILAGTLSAVSPAQPTISGAYLEVRSCDVYTGPCFANAEWGLTGKEGILVWSVQQGHWQGVNLQGLNVIAVLKSDKTLGDQILEPRQAQAVLVVDDRATPPQREALISFARSMAGDLIKSVAATRDLPMSVSIGDCNKSGCAQVRAGDLIEISTRCLGDKDHLCGNEEAYYPPLTSVTKAIPAFTTVAAFKGNALNRTWTLTGKRSAFIAPFSR